MVHRHVTRSTHCQSPIQTRRDLTLVGNAEYNGLGRTLHESHCGIAILVAIMSASIDDEFWGWLGT